MDVSKIGKKAVFLPPRNTRAYYNHLGTGEWREFIAVIFSFYLLLVDTSE